MLTTIGSKTGTADVSLNGVSYRALLREFENESFVQMIDSSVFSIEGVATQDPGMEQLRFRMMGIGKFGATPSGPFIPAPQFVPLVFTYSTGNTIAYTGNFERALARRTVNQNMIITGEGLSNGAFVVTWTFA